MKHIFSTKQVIDPPGAGMYHFREKTAGGESRVHLRIDAGGSGMLMVNASRVYHFNPTAAFMTYLLLQQHPPEQAIRSITHAYKVRKGQVKDDFENIARQIRLLITPGYEHAAGIIRDFSSLSAEDIRNLKQAGEANRDPRFIQVIRFLTPDHHDDLVALAPILANMEPEDRLDIIRNLEAAGQERLASLLRSLEKLDPLLVERLDELEGSQSDAAVAEPVFDTILPFSKTDLSAPYRMDLALTYQCSNRCHHCYNPAHRKREELDTAAWKQIIDQLWEIGVPHIIFTGGEPTLRPDLPDLIAHAEANGQITGINTNGRRLKDSSYVDKLVEAGLDHVQITIESSDARIHDEMVAHAGAWEETVAGIRNALRSRLYLMTNTTLLQNNAHNLRETLQFLSDLGVARVGLNALIYSGQGKDVGTGLPETVLPGLLEIAREMTQANHQKLTWYTPTQYCHFDPVLFDFQTLGVKGCTAALYNMCVEPDGKVLPCQSYYQPVGHILHDPWEKIWNSELALSIRNRSHVAEECRECSLISICGGGCPLAYLSGRISQPRTIQFLDALKEEKDVHYR